MLNGNKLMLRKRKKIKEEKLYMKFVERDIREVTCIHKFLWSEKNVILHLTQFNQNVMFNQMTHWNFFRLFL